jgi:hypothetical protein
MSSSAPSTAQLFFTSEGSYSEQESRQVAVAGESLTSFQRFTFDLPVRTLGNFRFDPLMTAGTVIIRDVAVRSGDSVLLRIPPADIVPFNEIASREQRGDQVSLSTVAAARDPCVVFRIHEPLRLRHIRFLQRMLRLLIGLAFVLTICVLLVVFEKQAHALMGKILIASRRIPDFLKHLDSVFADFGDRISNPDFLPIDSYAIWFYSMCLVIFLGAAAADLNGSSSEILARDYHHGLDRGVLFGAPKGSRSDEWAYFTPDTLNEVFRQHPFDAEHSEVGGHYVGLTANLPLLHITSIFRPQLWSFFVLPADYAYAVSWQFKGLLLVLGVFTWLLLFTRSTFWAVTGSFWFFFSAMTQWDYSWASALPEMIGSMCLSTVCGCYLTIGRNRVALLVASLGLVTCAINFAMCAYLPHVIPLAWVGVFSLAGWCWGKRSAILDSREAGFRIVAACIATGIIAMIAGITYRDLHQAIAIAAQTVYPGHRIERPGGTPHYLLLSHFMQWTETEKNLPPILGNLCESSGYLWLAPITLVCAWRLNLSRMQTSMLAFLWLCSCLFLAWMFLPVPALVGALTGLNRCGFKRMLPALGLLNIGIVVLCGARLRGHPSVSRWPVLRWVTPVIGFVICFLAFRYVNLQLGDHFEIREVVLFSLFITLLVFLYLERRSRAFALALLVPHVIAFSAVNPVQRGLPMFVDTDLRRFVAARPELLSGKWMVFSDAVVTSGFVAATGCDVYSGLHHIPDVDHFPLFAAHHLDLETLNRAGYLSAHLRGPGEPMGVKLRTIGFVEWDVAPADTILKDIGIKYLAFDFRPPAVWERYMTPLSGTPVDGFWLYELR